LQAIPRSHHWCANVPLRTPSLFKSIRWSGQERRATAPDIVNRVNEVSFNATLLKELRMIALLRQVFDAGNSEGARWAGMRIHRIVSAMMTDLG
jgi:hypothetical protein